MFSTLTQKLLLGVYIFVLLSIPIGTYLMSQSQTIKTSAGETKLPKIIAPVTPKPSASPARKVFDLSQVASGSAGIIASPTPEPSSPTIATSYGPTLSLKVALEGRSADNQTTKLFVGITEGALTSNPKFVLSFSVDLPASGEYGNLSLAGLNPGSGYTALLKGSAQIAAAAAFTMSPTVTNLNDGVPITLISGDLNEDNVINSADYSIAQKAIGIRNENADLNRDGVINAFDLGIIMKNMGKTGASGAWTSPLPKVATPSASLNTPSVGGPAAEGYWLWLPK
ncbi:MAG: dockerin type I repeat-containing protein [Candidatus Daviesbacteria bacterium]|nr:dockerin type I repeat-containing protein [Candidatus Daviesbacteria bacterium]